MPSDPNSSRKRNKPVGGQDLAVEQEQDQVVETEREQTRDTTQDQLGNHGVAAMLGIPSVQPGSAGVAMADAHRHEAEHELQFGGDDDAPVDGPLTLDDITRSWNQGTRRGNDRTTFEEPMPAEDLPAEDRDFVQAIRTDPARPTLPDIWTMDSLVQPSAETVCGDLQHWAVEAVRWGASGLAARALAHLIQPAAPCLQDPHGRVLLSRARVAALASTLVLDGPVLMSDPDPTTSGLVNLCLELAGRQHVVLDVFHAVQASDVRLPVARTVLDEQLEGRRDREVKPTPLEQRASTHLQWVLEGLMDLPSATTLLPAFPEHVEPQVEADEDPLGLDAIMNSFTGDPIDPLDGPYVATQQAAERLAAQCARLRVRLVGVSMAVADTCALWSSGAPTHNLRQVADQTDREVDRILQLLVEIARAAQGRRVAPAGIRNGLKRVARMLDKAQGGALHLLVAVMGGVLPGRPQVRGTLDRSIDDPLSGAWADGRPQHALPWLRSLPASLDRDAAILFTRAGAGEAGARLGREFAAIAEAATASDRPNLAVAAGIVQGSCALWAEATDEALALAAQQIADATARRNGICVAAATLLAVEAHLQRDDSDLAHSQRYAGAHVCWHLGTRGGFTLLARWTPPQTEAPQAGENPHTAHELPLESAPLAE